IRFVGRTALRGSLPMVQPRLVRLSVLALALLFARPAAVSAQGVAAPDAEDDPLPTSPLDARAWAKAKYEASRASVGKLAPARRAAAAGEYPDREKGFLEGRDTLDAVLDAARRQAQAELALCPTDADRVATLAGHWRRLQRIDGVNQL